MFLFFKYRLDCYYKEVLLQVVQDGLNFPGFLLFLFGNCFGGRLLSSGPGLKRPICQISGYWSCSWANKCIEATNQVPGDNGQTAVTFLLRSGWAALASPAQVKLLFSPTPSYSCFKVQLRLPLTIH